MPHFERPKLIRDGVYKHLRQAVLTGKLPPGQHLAETELGEQLGVSRTPIREALQRLVQDGLLVAQANKGVRVRQLSAYEAKEIYVVRQELDALAAALAAEHHTADDAQALQQALEQLEHANQQDYRTQTQLDLAFHAQITAAAHNHTLSELSRDLEQRIALIKHQTQTYNAHPDTKAQHTTLLQAILKRDTHSAREAARQHVRTFAELILQELAAEFKPNHPNPNFHFGVNND